MNTDNQLIYEAYLKESKLDKLQLALDVAGVEPSVGTVADIANAVISGLRLGAAASRKDGDSAKEHAINAGISVVSLIPFADVVKVVKLRKLRKPVLHAAKYAKGAGKSAKAARAAASGDKLTGRVQHDGPPPGSTPATGLGLDEKIQ